MVYTLSTISATLISCLIIRIGKKMTLENKHKNALICCKNLLYSVNILTFRTQVSESAELRLLGVYTRFVILLQRAFFQHRIQLPYTNLLIVTIEITPYPPAMILHTGPILAWNNVDCCLSRITPHYFELNKMVMRKIHQLASMSSNTTALPDREHNEAISSVSTYIFVFQHHILLPLVVSSSSSVESHATLVIWLACQLLLLAP